MYGIYDRNISLTYKTMVSFLDSSPHCFCVLSVFSSFVFLFSFSCFLRVKLVTIYG